MDSKEINISKKLLTMDSSGEFIEAVRSGDIARVQKFVEASPLSLYYPRTEWEDTRV
jgi:hypothetical protein